MRDLARYPLQESEILAWLQRQMELYLQDMAIGSLDGFIIQTLIKRSQKRLSGSTSGKNA